MDKPMPPKEPTVENEICSDAKEDVANLSHLAKLVRGVKGDLFAEQAREKTAVANKLGCEIEVPKLPAQAASTEKKPRQF